MSALVILIVLLTYFMSIWLSRGWLRRSMPAGCNCGPNSPLARALGCHCVRCGTAVIASQLPLPSL